ncbi:MAG: hypothetical protein J5565_05555 [Muribaculaceae bacterium]|nr:hypothetical protein [Muribaculaceae bacterium]
MKQEESEILKQIGKDPGFKIPENYFDDFNARMMDLLPEVEITEVDNKPSLWVTVRPYIYMAAMFAGVWCMMKVFTHFNQNISAEQRVSEVATGIYIDNNADEFIMSGGASDYDIMSYEDSVLMDANETQD